MYVLLSTRADLRDVPFGGRKSTFSPNRWCMRTQHICVFYGSTKRTDRRQLGATCRIQTDGMLVVEREVECSICLGCRAGLESLSMHSTWERLPNTFSTLPTVEGWQVRLGQLPSGYLPQSIPPRCAYDPTTPQMSRGSPRTGCRLRPRRHICARECKISVFLYPLTGALPCLPCVGPIVTMSSVAFTVRHEWRIPTLRLCMASLVVRSRDYAWHCACYQ